MFGGINNVTTIENLIISNSYAQNMNDSLAIPGYMPTQGSD
jgi:hypothetical protein